MFFSWPRPFRAGARGSGAGGEAPDVGPMATSSPTDSPEEPMKEPLQPDKKSTEAPDRPRRRFRLVTRGALIRLGVLFVILGIVALWAWFTMFRMPGYSYR